MTEEERTELMKFLDGIRRGALQQAAACDRLAKYLDICYINKEYLKYDDSDTVSVAVVKTE